MASGPVGTTPLNQRASSQELRRLVEQAQRGDRHALEELYLLHFDRIYSYLHMSVGNRHDAEDLTTQVFVKMLESIGKFRWRSAPFSAWLFRIAHNLRWTISARTSVGSPRRKCRNPIRAREAQRSKKRSSRSDGRACSS